MRARQEGTAPPGRGNLVKILQGDCYPPMISSRACWCHLASYSDSSARCAPAGTLPAFKIASVGFASLVSRAWCTLGTGNEFATATQANDDAGPLRHGRRAIRKIRRQEFAAPVSRANNHQASSHQQAPGMDGCSWLITTHSRFTTIFYSTNSERVTIRRTGVAFLADTPDTHRPSSPCHHQYSAGGAPQCHETRAGSGACLVRASFTVLVNSIILTINDSVKRSEFTKSISEPPC